MEKIALSILIWALASCSADKGMKGKNAAATNDPYAGLWSMLVLPKPPDVKPLKEGIKAVFKDASHSKGKGKVSVGTA
ncbi:MAG: hypothetical protein H7843_08080 [Nitrospirota bacterium]